MNFYKISIKSYLLLIKMLLISNIICSQEYSLNYNSDKIENKTYMYESYKDLVLSIEDSLSLFNKTGYLNAKVESFIKNDSFSYEVLINKNQKLKFIQIKNISIVHGDVLSILNKYVNKDNLIKFEEIEIIFNEISENLSKKGYPFAKTKLINYNQIDSKTIKSEISVDYGVKRNINKVIIKGYEKFPQKFINNIFLNNKNEVFDIDKISEKVKILNNLRFARSAKDPEILFTNDSTSLYLYIEKIKKNSFDGFIAFDSDENSGKINIQGYANINLINTFNKGEIINFNFRSENEQDRSLNSDLYIPYIFGTPTNLKYGINIVQRDSSFTSNENYIEIDMNFGKVKTGIGFEKIKSITELFLENIEDFDSSLLNIFSEYEKTNYEDKLIPNNFKLMINYGYGEKVQSENQINFSKFKIEIYKKFDFSSKLKLKSKFTKEEINSKNMLKNELLRFGGLNSIRGFEENSIYTNSYLMLNTSLNYYINDTIYIYTIFDLANYKNNVDDFEDDLYAGGIGFSATTENGIISVNYSKGNSWGNKFNLKNAKISINFVTYFW